MSASGTTKVKKTRQAPRKTLMGQRPASKMDEKRKDRLSTFTTKKAAETTRIQIEYSVKAEQRRSAAAARRWLGAGTRPMRWKATPNRASPASTSTIRHGSNFAVETRNWASAGLRR